MHDDLVVSGGGSTAVATVELFEMAQALCVVVVQLEQCVTRIDSIDHSVSLPELVWAVPAPFALAAEWQLTQVRTSIWLAANTARALAISLFASAEAYGVTERGAQHLVQGISAKLAYALGLIFPRLAAALGPPVAGTAAGGAVALADAPQHSREQLAAWLLDQNEALTNPLTVLLVRLGVMGADDFAAGVAAVNPTLMHILGDEGLGLLGLTSAAGAAVLLARPTGALAETPVRVARVSTRTDAGAALSYAARAERIPLGDAQIRIDRHQAEGRPDSFTVYLGGTKDLGLTAMSQPWDMTSNVNAMAMGDAGSYRAAKEAMLLAGIDASAPVQLVGYSQGGLIAAALAGSGEYNVQGMFTVGGVVSQDLVPQGVDWLAIEHSDDVMPALGGNRNAPDAVLVRREVFAGSPVPADSLLPAHELSRYRETAVMLDGSSDGRSDRMLERLNEISAGTTRVTSTTYLARRVG